MPNPPRCRSCNAPLLWSVTTAGRRLPLDAAPTPHGTIVVEDGVARVLKKGEAPAPGTARYTPHWAGCPFALDHRRT